MRNLIGILFLFILIGSCKDQDKKSTREEDIRMEGRNSGDSFREEVDTVLLEEAATEKDGALSDEEGEPPIEESNISSQGLVGRYSRMDENGNTSGCNCNCIEISFTKPTELCISPEKIYISATFEKTEENSVQIFLAEVTKAEEVEGDIPWDDFDRNTPIATASLQPDQTLKVDWIGFAIDGEIAIDYAIYGKKTLEGNYKKQ